MRSQIILPTQNQTLNIKNIFNEVNEDQKNLEKLYTEQHGCIRIDREEREDYS